MRSDMLIAQHLIADACAKYRNRPFGTLEGRTISYGEVYDRGGRLAVSLCEQGIEPGDRIGLLMANRLEYFIANMACVRGGFVNVPVNDMLTDEEYQYIFSDAGVRAVVLGPDFIDRFDEIRPEIPALETVYGITSDPPNGIASFDTAIAEADPLEQNHPVAADDPLRLSYTGGTTGKPKGAIHTHGGLGMSMVALTIDAEMRDGEEMLFMTPLSHACGYYHLCGMIRGAHFTLTQGFDADQFLDLVDSSPISWTFLVPTMLYRVLDADQLEHTDHSSLETIMYAAAPIAEHRIKEAIDTFGQIFIQLYGQTETAAVGTGLPKHFHEPPWEKIDSVGQAGVFTRVRIADQWDEESVEPLDPGEPGEVLIYGPYMMDGYHNAPEKTASTLVDGWVRTGDIGVIDEEGFIRLLDRKHDVIISGGMNVYSNEVEDTLEKCSEVAQVAVIGIPHDDWGEAVHAVVVPTTGDVTRTDITEYADEHLADYKKPKSVEFVEELPTTSYGKVDKTVLREPHWEGERRRIH